MTLMKSVLGFVLSTAAITAPAIASTKPPKLISIAASDVGSYRYAELSAQAEAIDKDFGSKLRVIPLGNAVARAIALRTKKAEIWQSCSAYFTAFEGIGDFAAETWGPQPLRLILMSNRNANFSPAVAGDSSIHSLADMKGKRVAWVVGNSGINIQTEAFLAAGGLTKKDVKLVEFPGYSASVRGLISSQVDVALAANTSPVTLEVASSGKGVKWIPIPKSDTAAWNKIEAKAPFVAPVTVTSGAGIKKGDRVEAAGYPCPQYVTLASQNEETAYWLTKMLVEAWPDYKAAIKSAPYWEIHTAIKSHFAVPYANGAIRYFKEIGVWTPDLEKHQQKLLKREKLLQAAFKKTKDSFHGASNAFPAYWQAERAKLDESAAN